MIFDGKPTREIMAEDMQRLVDERVPEDQHLDYKAQPYPSTPTGREELLKDVCAFANTDGGYIVIGIREDGQRRAEALVSVENPEQVRRSVIDRCLEKTDPRLTPDVGVIEIDGNSIVVVRVPESDRKPVCARPDAEHHSFWRRYEDGNKVMSVAEMRECFEGDTVQRALAEIQRELDALRRERVAEREADLEIHEGNVFQVQTDDLFLQHMERQFLATVGDQPFYRLTATPTPLNALDVRDKRNELIALLRHPPKLRAGGWDIAPRSSDVQQSAVGIQSERTDFRHLRLLWNGHVEFWTSAADIEFHWDHMFRKFADHEFLFPYAIIEPAANFVVLVREVCRIAEHTGQVRFGLGLYNIKGKFLAPHAPETFAYMHAQANAGQAGGPGPFGQDHLMVASVTASVEELPDAVAWRLVSQVYYRFNYDDEQIPCFDAEHRCDLGAGKRQPEQGSQ